MCPQFYCDLGDGFNEDHVIQLPELGTGVWSFRLHLPPPLCGLRFDLHHTAIMINHAILRVESATVGQLPPERVSDTLRRPHVVSEGPATMRFRWRNLRFVDRLRPTEPKEDAAALVRRYGCVHLLEGDVASLVGSHWLQLAIDLAEGTQIRPRIFIDLGSGLIEKHAIFLPPIGTGTWSFPVELRRTLTALRVDPHDRPVEIRRLQLRTTAPVFSPGGENVRRLASLVHC